MVRLNLHRLRLRHRLLRQLLMELFRLGILEVQLLLVLQDCQKLYQIFHKMYKYTKEPHLLIRQYHHHRL